MAGQTVRLGSRLGGGDARRVAGGGGRVLLVQGRFRPWAGDGLPDLAEGADELAAAVRRQWEAEVALRRLNDPYAMAVRWRAADPGLVESWASLLRLATSGAGWPPPRPEAWAAGPDELAGAPACRASADDAAGGRLGPCDLQPEAGSLADPAELLDTARFPTRAAVEEHLFDAFVPAAYRPHPDPARACRWKAGQAERWLVFLAKHLDRDLRGTTDLAWWTLRYAAPRPLVGLAAGPAAGLAGAVAAMLGGRAGIGFGVGLGLGIAVGLAVGLGVGTTTGLRPRNGGLTGSREGSPEGCPELWAGS